MDTNINFDIDKAMSTIIDIFRNPEVELVRLNGLHRYLVKKDGHNIDKSVIDMMVHKIKERKIITYIYILKCPHCGEITYQIKEREFDKLKRCETCDSLYVPVIGESLFELPYDYLVQRKKEAKHEK